MLTFLYAIAVTCFIAIYFSSQWFRRAIVNALAMVSSLVIALKKRGVDPAQSSK
jgi:hypothetical protein